MYHLDSNNVFRALLVLGLAGAARGSRVFVDQERAGLVAHWREDAEYSPADWLGAGILVGVCHPAWRACSGIPQSLGDKLIGLISFFGLSIPSVFFSLLMVLFAAKTGLFRRWDSRSSDVGGDESLAESRRHALAPGVADDRARHHRVGTICSPDAKRDDRDVVAGLHPNSSGEGSQPLASVNSTRSRERDQSAGDNIRFSLATLLAGALLTEFVFGWPGLGTLTFDALSSKDEPLVMASVVMLVLMLVIGNLIADVMLAIIDPRIRLE